jgi:hypothetical protein
MRKEWCSALSRMNLMNNFTLRKGKRDTALVQFVTPEGKA